MENSHTRGWSHFKLNINDWDTPFPKGFLEFINELGNTCSIGENGIKTLGILPVPQNIWSWRYLFLAYVYKCEWAQRLKC